MGLNLLVPDWLGRNAQSAPDRLALHCGALTWTFADLDRDATRLARQLASAGVGANQRVALLAQNGADYIVAVHALARLGAVLVPLNTRLTLDEQCWQVADVRASLLMCDPAYAVRASEIGARLPDLPRAIFGDEERDGALALGQLPEEDSRPLRTEIDLDSTQAIIYTSGTTGQPKGAIVTFGMQWWNAVASALNLGHDPADRWLACMPLYHIGGLAILFRSVIAGIGVSLHERFDAAAVNSAIREEGITIVSVVAVMLQRMLAALDDDGQERAFPATLRCVLLGGGPAPRPLLEDCARRCIPVVQTYGMTESCSQAATLAPEDALRKLGSAGKPLLPVQLRIVSDGDGAAVAAGEPGEIELRGPTITPGYVDHPEATVAAFHDGWLKTGDIGCVDGDGYLYVLDRRVDLIISGGENVYPAEIEAVLLEHPDVEEAGVCGMADSQWGQVPIAFVHVRPGGTTTGNALLSYVAERLARYKTPRAVHLVGPLPRTSSGKLLRRELPALLASARSPGV